MNDGDAGGLVVAAGQVTGLTATTASRVPADAPASAARSTGDNESTVGSARSYGLFAG
jgi:hypothetical protein